MMLPCSFANTFDKVRFYSNSEDNAPSHPEASIYIHIYMCVYGGYVCVCLCEC